MMPSGRPEKPLVELTCQECKKVFLTKNELKQYCGNPCRLKAGRNNPWFSINYRSKSKLL